MAGAPRAENAIVGVESGAITAVSEGDLHTRFDEASRELERMRAENERLRTLLALAERSQAVPAAAAAAPIFRSGSEPAPVGSDSAPAVKVALIRALFRGRQDVHALRWENTRTGKSGYVPAVAGGWTSSRDGPRTYLPLSDEVIERHLRGHDAVGIYPLLTDDRCWFVACDLDGAT